MNKNQNRPPLGLRVRLAREKVRLSQAKLATLLGFASYKTVAKLEKKHNICREYQSVAERWLATVERTGDEPTEKPLHVRLHETRLLKRVTVVRMAKLFGLSHETITYWENGPAHPNGFAIPREWIPLVERWITTGVAPSAQESKLARQRLVVIGSPGLADAVPRTASARSKRMTWKTFRRIFEQEATLGLKDKTIDTYRSVFNCFERVVKPKTIATVTERAVSRYAAHLRDYGRTPATINRHLAAIRRLLIWAYEQRITKDRPRIRLIRTQLKLPRIVNEQEFQRLIAATPNHRWSAFLLAGLYTGCRLGELLALEWRDIDFANGRILLRAEANKCRRDEWIPLHAGLVSVLQSLEPGSARVFNLGVRGVTNVSDRVRQIAIDAGIDCTMHDLRRSTASWLAKEGVPIQIVQRILRHSDPRTTMQYYTNVESSLTDAIAKLSPASIESAGFRVPVGKAVPA